MGVCCACLKWSGRSKKSKYLYTDFDQVPLEASLTQLLVDDDDDHDEELVGNKHNKVTAESKFVTEEERQLVKDKKYEQLMKLHDRQNTRVTAELAAQEAKISFEEESRFEEERLVLFGVEVDLESNNSFANESQGPSRDARHRDSHEPFHENHSNKGETHVQLHAVETHDHMNNRQSPSESGPKATTKKDLTDVEYNSKGDVSFAVIESTPGNSSSAQHLSDQSDLDLDLDHRHDSDSFDLEDEEEIWSSNFVSAQSQLQKGDATQTHKIQTIAPSFSDINSMGDVKTKAE